MKERGILMTVENVRATKDGRKLESRRTTAHGLKEINQNPDAWELIGVDAEAGAAKFAHENDPDPFGVKTVKSRYGGVGTLLWVRETFVHCDPEKEIVCGVSHDISPEVTLYRADLADDEATAIKWKPSIFMPRWASRITMVRKTFRMERLQDIGWAGAIAEGIKDPRNSMRRLIECVPAFQELWESINGPGSWGANPWVEVVGWEKAEVLK